MKNKISLKRISVATITGSIVMLVLVPLLVGAAPAATPTRGNVDANFNTVRVGYGITAPSVSVDVLGRNIGINAVANDAINSTGGEFFGHSNGVLGESLSAGGIGVRGRGIGAFGFGISGYNTDINGTAGIFENSGMTNTVRLATPTEALRAQANGVAVPAIYANSSGGHGILTWAADNSRVGIYSLGGYGGGFFANRNNMTDNFVNLGTLTKAIAAIGVITNNTWEVSKTGAISSPQEPIGASSYIFANITACTNAGGTPVAGVVCMLPVRFFDTDGVSFGNNAGTVNLRIDGSTGSLSNPGSSNGGTVTIKDADGLAFLDSTDSQVFKMSEGALIGETWGIQNSKAGEAVRISDNEGLVIGADATHFDRLLLTNNGTITHVPMDSGFPSPVIIKDGSGFKIQDESATPIDLFKVDGDAVISNPGTKNGGEIKIADTLSVTTRINSDDLYTNYLNTPKGYVGWLSTAADNPYDIYAKYLSAPTVYAGTGGITTAGGIATSGGLQVGGHIKAAGGIGSYTTRSVSQTAASATAICNSGEIAVSCGGYSTAGLQNLRHGRINVIPPYSYYTDRCYAYDGDAAVSITAYAFCFNPNG